MDREKIIRELKSVEEKYRDKFTPTFEVSIYDMARDCRIAIEELMSENARLSELLKITTAREMELSQRSNELLTTVDRLTSENEKAWKQLHEEIEKEREAAAERDAAISDMVIMANAIRESELLDTVMREGCCFTCKHEHNTECPGYDSDECFEWRGIEPAKSEESVTQSMPEDMRNRFRESYSGAKTFAELDYKSKLGVWDTN